jgi:hypothetical protein
MAGRAAGALTAIAYHFSRWHKRSVTAIWSYRFTEPRLALLSANNAWREMKAAPAEAKTQWLRQSL